MYGYGYRYNSGLVIGAGGGAPFVNTKSIIFDGTDQYLNMGAPAALSSASSFSISLWIKLGSSATTYRRVFGRYISAADNLFLMMQQTTHYLQFFVSNGGAAAGVVSNVAISNFVWQNVTVVFDGTLTGNQNRAKIYLDGTNVTATDVGTLPATTSVDASDFLFSKVNGLGAAYWWGNMDEQGLFNYPLSQSQVTSIYNGGAPQDLMNTSGLTQPSHYYRNGDSVGDVYPTIADVGSAASKPSTMTNMNAGDIVEDTP